MSNLPAFFQTKGKTVLEELENYDEESNDLLLDSLIEEDNNLDLYEELEAADDETFGNLNQLNYNDLQSSSLPDFFSTPTSSNVPTTSNATTSATFDASKIISSATSSTSSLLSSNNINLWTTSSTFPSTTTPSSSASTRPPPGLPPGLIKKTPAPVPLPLSSSAPTSAPTTSSYQAISGAENFLHRGGAPLTSNAAASVAAPPLPVPLPISSVKSYASATSGSVPETTPSIPQPPSSPSHSTPSSPTPTPSTPPPSSSAAASATTSPAPSSLSKNFFSKASEVKSKYMQPSDIKFIMIKALQPLESSDPYADDYYYLQYMIKKNQKIEENASKNPEEASEVKPIQIPLPTWKDTKERIKLQMENSKKNFEKKIKDWEKKEQVLGHIIKSNINQPRELLNFNLNSSSASASKGGENGEKDGSNDDEEDVVIPFVSRLWTTRIAVQQGYEALYMVQELQHLLSSSIFVNNVSALDDIKKEMDLAIQLLSQSLGIRSNSSSLTSYDQNIIYSLDGRHVAALLQTIMGKKLLARGLKFLNPQHKWILIPVILARILNSNSSSVPSTSSAEDNLLAEKKLLKVIIEYLHSSYQHYKHLQNVSQQSHNNNVLYQNYINEFITNLRQCLKNIMVTLLDNNSLKNSLKMERTRAEIIQLVIQIGDVLQYNVSSILNEEWNQTRDAFMSFLDN